MKFQVTIPVTFTVLADDAAEAEHAAMDAVEEIPLVDGIVEVAYTLDASLLAHEVPA